MSNVKMATGTVEGTGSAINVELGFTPSYVELVNIDGDAIMVWNDQYADASGYKTVAAGTNALVASGGITPYAGVAGTTGKGFTIGADTDVNASSETINWTAWGHEQ